MLDAELAHVYITIPIIYSIEMLPIFGIVFSLQQFGIKSINRIRYNTIQDFSISYHWGVKSAGLKRRVSIIYMQRPGSCGIKYYD